MSTLTLPADGPVIATEDDVRDIIGETFGTGVDTVVIPARRLSPAFFQLSSGLAGAMLQKFTNYRIAVIIVGDIAAHLETSSALRDFVRESNRRGEIRFLEALPPA
jgi:hypothetical protein